MAPPSRLTAPTDEPPGLTAGGPLTTDDVIRRGVTLGGRPVRRLTVDFDTGSVTVEFGSGADDGGEASSPLRARIVSKLGELPTAVNRKQLAKVLGLKSTGGRFAQETSALVEVGEILERGGLLTDDATKFPDGD